MVRTIQARCLFRALKPALAVGLAFAAGCSASRTFFPDPPHATPVAAAIDSPQPSVPEAVAATPPPSITPVTPDLSASPSSSARSPHRVPDLHPSPTNPGSAAAPDLRDRPPEPARAAPRLALLHLGRPRHQAEYARNILGIHVTSDELSRVARRLRQEHVDVVVLDITLQGGYWLEAQHIQQVLIDEYLPYFRTIAWIDEAVTGAAIAFAVVPDIVFRSSGIYGPCPAPVGWARSQLSWPGATLAASPPTAASAAVLDSVDAACRVGGHNPLFFRSMMLAEPLSAKADPAGIITLSPDEQHGKVVNPAGRLLTLNAGTATRLGFARGVADTLEQLTTLLRLGECVPAGTEAAKGLDFVAAQARTDESRVLDLLESIRSRLLLTDSAIEGWERDEQASLAGRDLDELESILVRNALYPIHFASEAQVPHDVGAINRIWFDAIRQGLDSLRRRHLPLDEVADSIQM